MVGSSVNEKTLFIRNLPLNCTNAKLEGFFGEVGPLKQAFVVNNKGTQQCKGIGYVTFATSDDAKRAIKELKTFEGKRLQLSLAKKKLSRKEKEQSKSTEKKDKHLQFNTDRKTRKEKKSRLIVRNLSFKCNEDTLKEVFEKAGDVAEVIIPKTPEGRMKGFGIVQFQNVIQAAKAVGSFNGINIKGRPIAVDWALPKLRYEREVSTKGTTVADDSAEDENDSEGEEGGAGGKAEGSAGGKEEGSSGGKGEGNDGNEESDQSEAVSDTTDDEDPRPDVTDSANASETDVQEEVKIDEGEDAEDDDMEEDDDSLQTDEDQSECGAVDKRQTKRRTPTAEDVNEGQTLFVRNVPFDADEATLRTVFKRFGPMLYCKLVVDPLTEYSKGTAFIKYRKLESAESCLKIAQNPEKVRELLRVDGRELLVSRAVDRGEAKTFNKKKSREKVDKRNLWLASEGLLRAGMPAAKGLSDLELNRRKKIEAVKRQKLKDVNVFISPTRLCVHNIPRNIDDKRLRTLMLGVIKDKSAKIDECRVMRDLRNVSADGVPRSLGYAFVNFTQHEHALSALRAANNNPELWGKQKRPIVEFSLENKLKLLSRQRRHDRVKAKQEKASTGPRGKLQIANPAPVPREDGRPARKGLPKLKTRARWRDAERQEQARQRKHQEKVQRKKQLHRAARRDDDDEPKQQQEKGQKRPRREKSDSFDKLVSSYKQKLFGSTTDVQTKKWFEG